MKKLMVLLVVLVSGLGYSQKPTDTIPTTNINSNLMNQCVIDEVNKERKKLGLHPFIVTEGAMEFSKEHTEWVVKTGKFEHSKNDTYGECMTKANFWGGESYEGAAKRIVANWMNSPPHRKVLMSRDYVECGAHTIFRFESTEHEVGWITKTTKIWYSTSSFTLRMYN
jgi:uncharacterized protein YkwD